jgi:hypothetical protein
MQRWAREERQAFVAVVAAMIAGLLALGLRAEFGPVGEWGCAWRVERGDATAPDLSGMRLEDARRRLDDQHPCVGLRVVGNPPPDQLRAVVHNQSPAAGHDLDRRTLDVVVG